MLCFCVGGLGGEDQTAKIGRFAKGGAKGDAKGGAKGDAKGGAFLTKLYVD